MESSRRSSVAPGERLLIREVLVPTAAGFAGRWRVEPVPSGD